VRENDVVFVLNQFGSVVLRQVRIAVLDANDFDASSQERVSRCGDDRIRRWSWTSCEKNRDAFELMVRTGRRRECICHLTIPLIEVVAGGWRIHFSAQAGIFIAWQRFSRHVAGIADLTMLA
jgi:hypothetical protein